MRSRVLFVLAFASCTSNESSWKPVEHPPGYSACKVIHDLQGTGKYWEERRTFDTDGNLIHSSLTGEVTRDVAYTYDRDRVLTATTSSTLSYMSKLERWTYDDERGHVLRYERDDAPQPTLDGKPDYIEIYTYADNGQLLRMDRDRDGDGMIEPSDYDTFTYDAYGCIATKSDGSSGYRDLQRYTLNPACKPLEIDHDTNSDGAIDYTETWTYLYNVLPNDYHNSNDGRGYWSYDDQRRLTADTMQTQLINGSIDENSYSYDCGM